MHLCVYIDTHQHTNSEHTHQDTLLEGIGKDDSLLFLFATLLFTIRHCLSSFRNFKTVDVKYDILCDLLYHQLLQYVSVSNCIWHTTFNIALIFFMDSVIDEGNSD